MAFCVLLALSYALLLHILVLLQKIPSSFPLIALLSPAYPSEGSSAVFSSRKLALVQSGLNIPHLCFDVTLCCLYENCIMYTPL